MYCQAYTFRNLKNLDPELFYTHVVDAPWNVMYNIPNIDDKVTYFNTLINGIFNIHAPLKTTTFNKPAAPWITDTYY